MFAVTSLAFLLAAFPQEKSDASAPRMLPSKVLDVMGGDLVLLSVGTEQGVTKGLNGHVARTTPDGNLFWGQAEFVEVGAKHSILRVKRITTIDLSKMSLPEDAWAALYVNPWQDRPLQANDSVTWYALDWVDPLNLLHTPATKKSTGTWSPSQYESIVPRRHGVFDPMDLFMPGPLVK